MTEHDRILDAFRNCITEPKCKDCPWTECEELDNRKIKIPADLALAVMRELAAQEPRVLTTEEVHGLLKRPIWKETRSSQKDLYTGWVLAYDIQTGKGITGTRLGMAEPSGRMAWYRLEDYGKTWRCWDKRPTDKQREAITWN